MTQPLVSVVVPSFQNASTIGRTLGSVLGQGIDDLEVVVSDHSSTDGTLAAVAPFLDDPRVRLVSTPDGGGAERNWNRATDEARGRYLKLVCGDDVLYPGCLQTQVDALEQHPTAGVCAVQRDLVGAGDQVLLRGRGLGGLRGLVPGPEAVRATVRAGANLLGEPMCTLLRTDLVRQVGGWRATQPYLIDEDLYVRVLRHADLVAVPQALAAFRLTSTQWSVRLATEQARQAGAFHERVRHDFPEHVSWWDEHLGTAQALRTAWLRRAAYVVWRKKMAVAA